jgi:hypothetical protein
MARTYGYSLWPAQVKTTRSLGARLNFCILHLLTSAAGT